MSDHDFLIKCYSSYTVDRGQLSLKSTTYQFKRKHLESSHLHQVSYHFRDVQKSCQKGAAFCQAHHEDWMKFLPLQIFKINNFENPLMQKYIHPEPRDAGDTCVTNDTAVYVVYFTYIT